MSFPIEDPSYTVDMSTDFPMDSSTTSSVPISPVSPGSPGFPPISPAALIAMANKYKADPSLLFDSNCYGDMHLLITNLDKLVSIFPVRDKYKCKQGESEVFIYSKKSGLTKSMEGCTRSINFSGNREMCGNSDSDVKIISNWLDRQKFGQDNAQVNARRFMLGRVVSKAEYTLVAVKWDLTVSIEQRVAELEKFKEDAIHHINALYNVLSGFNRTFAVHQQIIAQFYPGSSLFNGLHATQPNFPSNTHVYHPQVPPFFTPVHAENFPSQPTFFANTVDNLTPASHDGTTTTTTTTTTSTSEETDMDSQQIHLSPNPNENLVFPPSSPDTQPRPRQL
jgi:hypothetical protein